MLPRKYMTLCITSDTKFQSRNKEDSYRENAFCTRKELTRGKLNKNLKKRIIKSMIRSVVLCCAETRTLRRGDVKRLKGFEKWIWSRMKIVSWMEHGQASSFENISKLKERERELDIVVDYGAIGFANLPWKACIERRRYLFKRSPIAGFIISSRIDSFESGYDSSAIVFLLMLGFVKLLWV